MPRTQQPPANEYNIQTSVRPQINVQFDSPVPNRNTPFRGSLVTSPNSGPGEEYLDLRTVTGGRAIYHMELDSVIAALMRYRSLLNEQDSTPLPPAEGTVDAEIFE